jgi:hypothetical protein
MECSDRLRRSDGERSFALPAVAAERTSARVEVIFTCFAWSRYTPAPFVVRLESLTYARGFMEERR